MNEWDICDERDCYEQEPTTCANIFRQNGNSNDHQTFNYASQYKTGFMHVNKHQNNVEFYKTVSRQESVRSMGNFSYNKNVLHSKWLESISTKAMEKIKSILSMEDLSTAVEGGSSKDAIESKDCFTEDDFNEVAKKLSQEIEKYDDITHEKIKSIIRRLKNNISSKKYRERIKNKQKTSTTTIRRRNSTTSNQSSDQKESSDPNSETTYYEWEKHLISKQRNRLFELPANILTKFSLAFKNDPEMLENLAENLKPDETKKLHDEKVFKKIVRRIQTNVYTKRFHQKEKFLMRKKRKEYKILVDKNQSISNEIKNLDNQAEELRHQLKSVHLTEQTLEPSTSPPTTNIQQTNIVKKRKGVKRKRNGEITMNDALTQVKLFIKNAKRRKDTKSVQRIQEQISKLFPNHKFSSNSYESSELFTTTDDDELVCSSPYQPQNPDGISTISNDLPRSISATPLRPLSTISSIPLSPRTLLGYMNEIATGRTNDQNARISPSVEFIDFTAGWSPTFLDSVDAPIDRPLGSATSFEEPLYQAPNAQISANTIEGSQIYAGLPHPQYQVNETYFPNVNTLQYEQVYMGCESNFPTQPNFPDNTYANSANFVHAQRGMYIQPNMPPLPRTQTFPTKDSSFQTFNVPEMDFQTMTVGATSFVQNTCIPSKNNLPSKVIYNTEAEISGNDILLQATQEIMNETVENYSSTNGFKYINLSTMETQTEITSSTHPYAVRPSMRSQEVQYRTNEIFNELYREYNFEMLVLTHQFESSIKQYLNITIHNKEIKTVDAMFTINRIEFPEEVFEDEGILVAQAQEMNVKVVMSVFRNFMSTYFSVLLNKCLKVDAPERLKLYEQAWTTFINASMNMRDKFKKITISDDSDQLLPVHYQPRQRTNDEDIDPIFSKALKAWEYSFFKHEEFKLLIPSAVMKLIAEEESGRPENTSKIPNAIVISYQVLGVIKKNGVLPTRIDQVPSPLSYYEFIQYHVKQRDMLLNFNFRAIKDTSNKIMEVDNDLFPFRENNQRNRNFNKKRSIEYVEKPKKIVEDKNSTFFYSQRIANQPASNGKIVNDSTNNFQQPEWMKSISEKAMQRINSIANRETLKEIFEGKRDTNSVKYVFTENDFQDVALKMSQEIEELQEKKFYLKDLKEIIRRLKNNISSREYRKRLTTHEKAAEKAVLSDQPSDLTTQNQFDTVQRKTMDTSGIEETEWKDWEQHLTSKQTENIRLVPSELIPTLVSAFKPDIEMLKNLADNLDPEEAKTLHDEKVFKALVRRIKNNIHTRRAHKKEKLKINDKKKEYDQLVAYNKKLQDQLLFLEKDYTQMINDAKQIQISNSETTMDFEYVDHSFFTATNQTTECNNTSSYHNSTPNSHDDDSSGWGDLLESPLDSPDNLLNLTNVASNEYDDFNFQSIMETSKTQELNSYRDNRSPSSAIVEKSQFLHEQITLKVPTQEWRRLRCNQFGFKKYNEKIIFNTHVSTIEYNYEPYYYVPMMGDGNCLFRSLAYCITGFQDEHVEMRKLICTFMRKNSRDPRMIKWVQLEISDKIPEAQAIETYFQIRKTDYLGKWGSEVEIFVFAKIFGCVVYVFSPRNKLWQRHAPNQDDFLNLPTFFLRNTDNNHFDVCKM